MVDAAHRCYPAFRFLSTMAEINAPLPPPTTPASAGLLPGPRGWGWPGRPPATPPGWPGSPPHTPIGAAAAHRSARTPPATNTSPKVLPWLRCTFSTAAGPREARRHYPQDQWRRPQARKVALQSGVAGLLNEPCEQGGDWHVSRPNLPTFPNAAPQLRQSASLSNESGPGSAQLSSARSINGWAGARAGPPRSGQRFVIGR